MCGDCGGYRGLLPVHIGGIDKIGGHQKPNADIKEPKQFLVSVKTATETSDAIFTIGVTRTEAAMPYQGVFRPKVKYPLAQSFLTEKQVEKIESVSVPKIMAKCGYNRSTGLPIRGGPKVLGGAGFYSLLNTIGASRVQHFLKN